MKFRGYKTYKDWEGGNYYQEVNIITDYNKGIHSAKKYQSLENYHRVDIYNKGILLGSIINGVFLKSFSEYFVQSELSKIVNALLSKSVNTVSLEILPNFEKGTFCVNVIDSSTLSKVEGLKLKDEEISMVSEGLHLLTDVYPNLVEKLVLQKKWETCFLLYKEREV